MVLASGKPYLFYEGLGTVPRGLLAVDSLVVGADTKWTGTRTTPAPSKQLFGITERDALPSNGLTGFGTLCGSAQFEVLNGRWRREAFLLTQEKKP